MIFLWLSSKINYWGWIWLKWYIYLQKSSLNMSQALLLEKYITNGIISSAAWWHSCWKFSWCGWLQSVQEWRFEIHRINSKAKLIKNMHLCLPALVAWWLCWDVATHILHFARHKTFLEQHQWMLQLFNTYNVTIKNCLQMQDYVNWWQGNV